MYGKRKEISGHAAAIYSCVAQENFIYSAGGDKFVARWKIDEGVQDNFSIRFENAVYAIELVGNDHLAVGLANGDLHIFDLNTNSEIKFYTQHRVGIFEIKYNEVKKHLYVADADGNLSIWDENFALTLYLPLACGKIRNIDVDPLGENIALACQDGTCRIFETNFFNEIHTLNAHDMGCTSVLFDPFDNELLLTGGKDAYLKCWNWSSEKCLRLIPAHNFAIYDIVSQNTNEVSFVTASRDKTIKLWSRDLSIVKRLDAKEGGHRHSVNKLFKLSNSAFVSCSDDKKMIIWNRQE